jgi:peroxiredoxin
MVAGGDQWKGTMNAEKDRLRFAIESTGNRPPIGPVKFHKETLVDEATGFVYREQAEFPTRRYVTEDWQFGPQKQTNGAVLPSLRFHFEYSNGKFMRAELVVIDEVEMLDRVPPETFAVAVPPGTYVLDYRGISQAEMSSGSRPRSAVLSEPVPDVVARANEFRARKPSVLKAGDLAPPLDVAKWVVGHDAAAAPALGGKIVLVNFSAHWCGFCHVEWAQIEAASRHFAKDDVLVVGIYDTADSEANVQQDIEKEKLTYRIALDKSGPRKHSFGGKTFQAYGIDAVPESAVIGRDGRIAYIGHLGQALETVARLSQAK